MNRNDMGFETITMNRRRSIPRDWSHSSIEERAKIQSLLETVEQAIAISYRPSGESPIAAHLESPNTRTGILRTTGKFVKLDPGQPEKNQSTKRRSSSSNINHNNSNLYAMYRNDLIIHSPSRKEQKKEKKGSTTISLDVALAENKRDSARKSRRDKDSESRDSGSRKAIRRKESKEEKESLSERRPRRSTRQEQSEFPRPSSRERQVLSTVGSHERDASTPRRRRSGETENSKEKRREDSRSPRRSRAQSSRRRKSNKEQDTSGEGQLDGREANESRRSSIGSSSGLDHFKIISPLSRSASSRESFERPYTPLKNRGQLNQSDHGHSRTSTTSQPFGGASLLAIDRYHLPPKASDDVSRTESVGSPKMVVSPKLGAHGRRESPKSVILAGDIDELYSSQHSSSLHSRRGPHVESEAQKQSLGLSNSGHIVRHPSPLCRRELARLGVIESSGGLPSIPSTPAPTHRSRLSLPKGEEQSKSEHTPRNRTPLSRRESLRQGLIRSPAVGSSQDGTINVTIREETLKDIDKILLITEETLRRAGIQVDPNAIPTEDTKLRKDNGRRHKKQHSSLQNDSLSTLSKSLSSLTAKVVEAKEMQDTTSASTRRADVSRTRQRKQSEMSGEGKCVSRRRKSSEAGRKDLISEHASSKDADPGHTRKRQAAGADRFREPGIQRFRRTGMGFLNAERASLQARERRETVRKSLVRFQEDLPDDHVVK